ncbi:MAG: type III polyketide synthase [Balneolaceae bacterium]
MPAYIHTIAQQLPQYSYKQTDLRERMKEIVPGDEREQRLLHHIYNRSGIETRHSVVDDFHATGSHKLYFNGEGSSPGTGSRNRVFTQKGRELFVSVARQLLDQSKFRPDEITHLITVSCTGFYAPGPDYDIIRALNLPVSTERYHLGFMGCYAAIPALKLASRLCHANADAVVMVVSVELCTLHFQASSKPDDLISASVFSDGGAGAIVHAQKPEGRPHFSLNEFRSSITEKGSDDMAWTIGDTGFRMVLSSYIPQLLGDGLEPFLQSVLDHQKLSPGDIDIWAVHPGGRAILDKAETALNLPANSLEASRRVLANYGNMSSATILFVLNDILQHGDNKPESTTAALAFGPGLTIESALLTRYSS